MSERAGFYRRTLESLLADGVLARDDRILVVAGGEADREAFAGFPSVTITNVSPEEGEEFQDAEALTYEDGSFDFAVVSAGLHHCRSPHRAVLELYRVARKGLLAVEARDSLLTEGNSERAAEAEMLLALACYSREELGRALEQNRALAARIGAATSRIDALLQQLPESLG